MSRKATCEIMLINGVRMIKDKNGVLKRAKSTKAEMQIREEGLYKVFERYTPPLTIRQVYYVAFGLGVVPKDPGYTYTKDGLLKMRRDGRIPYEWVIDQGRRQHIPATYMSLDDYLEVVRTSYRRNPWETQPIVVKVLSEKDTLLQTLYSITSKYRVGLVSAHGYISDTALFNMIQEVKGGKRLIILQLVDHDPSGDDMIREADERIKLFVGKENVNFRPIALTEEQISRYHLPTMPLPQKGEKGFKDPRRKRWVAAGHTDVTELDALPPDILRKIVEDAIVDCIDRDAWDACMKIEREENERLKSLIGAR